MHCQAAGDSYDILPINRKEGGFSACFVSSWRLRKSTRVLGVIGVQSSPLVVPTMGCGGTTQQGAGGGPVREGAGIKCKLMDVMVYF